MVKQKRLCKSFLMSSMAHHGNDIEKYLIYIKNNLHMITSSSATKRNHSGLITYILCQLKQTAIAAFLCYIQDLHKEYQEGKLPKYIPLKLIQDVEDKIQVLKHTEVWDAASHPEAPAMALNSTMKMSNQLKEFLANHISDEIKKRHEANKDNNRDGKVKHRFQHQERMFVGPANLNEIKTVNGHNYNWCTKCNRGNGQWVQSHTTDTHQDGFCLKLKNSEASKKGSSTKRVHKGTTQDSIPKSPPIPTSAIEHRTPRLPSWYQYHRPPTTPRSPHQMSLAS
jgi:hypothetical protein